MFFQRLSLRGNVAALSFLIGTPYLMIWWHLLVVGRVDELTIGMIGALLIADLLLLYGFVRGLMRALALVSDALGTVAGGDFTRTLQHRYDGEFGRMLDDVNRSIVASRKLITTLLDNTVDVAASSFETITASARVVYNVDEEAQQVRAISEAGRRISDSISGIIKDAGEADASAQSARGTLLRSEEVVAETMRCMGELAGTAVGAAKRVESLGESSRRVGEISGVIGEIAAQTNLLALNAAIEAARAGEHGRGFAVVADEVRALAERTSKATGEITARIDSIQQEIGAVIEGMHASLTRAEEAREATGRTGTAVAEVRRQIDTLGALIADIARATEAQGSATREIAQGIGIIEGLSAANTTHAHRAVDIVQAMDATVSRQLRTFDGFAIPAKALMLARSDHMLWKKRLTEMLLGRQRIEPGEVTDQHACRFGRWYDGEGRAAFGAHPAFAAIEEPHRQVHAAAREIVSLYQAGRRDEAQQKLEWLAGPTAAVLDGLERLRSQLDGEPAAAPAVARPRVFPQPALGRA
jgi:methyl-accepting chemotaxis protein